VRQYAVPILTSGTVVIDVASEQHQLIRTGIDFGSQMRGTGLMIRAMKWLLLAVLVGASFSGEASALASTTNAASCSLIDVQAAISSASSGDTIIVPGGSCTWATVLAIPSTKVITLNGQGVTINGALDVTSGSSTSNVTSITGFTWTSTGYCGTTNAITTHSTVSTGWVRIFSNTFSENTNGTFICTEGDGTHALIDHNTFTLGSSGGGAELIHVLGDSSAGWSTDVVPGGPDMVFIETNTFTYNCSSGCNFGGTSAVQSYWGARTVFRNNLVTDMQVDEHGTCGLTWARWWELYNNNFIVNPAINQSNYFAIRGGSGVIYGNTIINPSNNSGGGYLQLTDDCSGTYPDRDQIGRGINQISSPAYLWSTDPHITISSTSADVQLNRDYLVSSSQPTTLNRCQSAADVSAGCPVSYAYTPYVYPHPLTNGSAGLPSPPTNVTAVIE
jgi:hypothetical protein